MAAAVQRRRPAWHCGGSTASSVAVPWWEAWLQRSAGGGINIQQSTKSSDCNSDRNGNYDSDDYDDGRENNDGNLPLPIATAANATLSLSCRLTRLAGRSCQGSCCLSRRHRQRRALASRRLRAAAALPPPVTFVFFVIVVACIIAISVAFVDC